jgi:hypothetical protein
MREPECPRGGAIRAHDRASITGAPVCHTDAQLAICSRRPEPPQRFSQYATFTRNVLSGLRRSRSR